MSKDKMSNTVIDDEITLERQPKPKERPDGEAFRKQIEAEAAARRSGRGK